MRTRCRAIISAVLLGSVALTSAHDLICTASLSGPNESPPNNSPATGSVTVTIDLDLFTMRVEANFGDLQGTVTTAHIHAATPSPLSGTAGIASQMPGFAMFPAGVTNGTYDHTFDLADAASYNPDFIAANGGTISTASNALFAALIKGKAYLDIHTTAFADGEIRGFLIGPKILVTQMSAMSSGGQISIAINGTVEPFGAGVLLERSVDMQGWSGVAVGDSDPDNGEFSFNVTEPSGTLTQFYRVVDLLEPNERPAKKLR